jgi:hypothetical protein
MEVPEAKSLSSSLIAASSSSESATINLRPVFEAVFEGVECRIIDDGSGKPLIVLSVLLFFRLFSASAASQMASAELLIPSASDEESLQLLTFIFPDD